MTDEKKPNSTRRAPRKRGRAKPQPRSPDAAERNPGAPATDVARSDALGHAGNLHESAASTVLAAIPLHVRWRDLDAFNHVNNSSYLTFLEEARLQWLRTVPGEWFTEHAMPVMAAFLRAARQLIDDHRQPHRGSE